MEGMEIREEENKVSCFMLAQFFFPVFLLEQNNLFKDTELKCNV